MKKLFGILLQVCLITGFLLISANAVSAESAARYGYTQLANDNQRAAYNAVVGMVENVQSETIFEINGITQDNIYGILEDIKCGCQMVTKDYPEFFWFDGDVIISVHGSQITIKPNAYSVNGTQITDVDELAPYIDQLDQAVDAALAKIEDDFSDYEIALTFHDHIIDSCSYVIEGDHQTVYGALVSGKAVCAGYAKAYQLLMNRAGIRCFYVTGHSTAPDGQLVAHAWNLVWLDGMCYYTDVTWDDQGSDLFHEYLNMSKEEISKTHFTSDPLPESCGHDTYTFFVKNNTDKGVCDYQDHKTPAEIAECFELKSVNGDQVSYYCTIHYHGDDFRQWFDENKIGIIKALELTGIVQCQTIELGREHHVTFTGKLVLPTGVFTKLTKSLSLTDVIFINQRVGITGFEGIDLEAKGGLLSWIGTELSAEEAVIGTEGITNIAGLKYDATNDRYAQQTRGIYSNMYGKVVYMRFYAEVADGIYVYSDIYEDSVLSYCDTVLEKSSNVKQKNTCAALLYYGAAAQVYFDKLTDGLISDYVPAGYEFVYEEAMLDELKPIPGTSLVDGGKVRKFGHTLSLVEAIRINYNVTTLKTGNARLLLWYEGAQSLDADNYDYAIKMTWDAVKNRYSAQSDLVYSVSMGNTIYACVELTDAEGNITYSGIDVFSAEAYAGTVVANSTDEAMIELVKRMVIYGEMAKLQFAG